ncbi:MAG TPA: hypothetical protein VHR72_06920 [Gemmataceae bacterium]|nr:hypothetical protein [Gemmataceae bacterium]
MQIFLDDPSLKAVEGHVMAAPVVLLAPDRKIAPMPKLAGLHEMVMAFFVPLQPKSGWIGIVKPNRSAQRFQGGGHAVEAYHFNANSHQDAA